MSRFKYEFLLSAQLLLSVISPVFSATSFSQLIFEIALSLVLATALYVIASRRVHLIIGLALMIPSFVLLWLARPLAMEILEIVAFGFAIVFLCYIVFLILSDILNARLITLNVIAGGISVYLLIGNLFGLLFAIIGRLNPKAFIIPGELAAHTGSSIGDTSTAMYFSLVTLTTLGFGDITPVSTLARSLVTLEAVIGQLYLAILIASLVGMHIAGRPAEARGDTDE